MPICEDELHAVFGQFVKGRTANYYLVIVALSNAVPTCLDIVEHW